MKKPLSKLNYYKETTLLKDRGKRCMKNLKKQYKRHLHKAQKYKS